jgi:GDP-4-dehydro-6-deoxy-D-mannose reductase
VIARPFNHIGERQTPQFVIPAFAKQIVAIERGEQDVIQVGNLEAIRDFSDVKDMVQAYITLMSHGQAGEAYNIGSGQGQTVKAMLDQLCTLSTTTVRVETDPARLRPIDLPRLVANAEKMRALGWQPTIPMTETLQRILEYWRSQPSETDERSRS